MPQTIEFSIEQGDITSFSSDVVAIKYAQDDFSGTDRIVRDALRKKEILIEGPQVGEYRYLKETQDSIQAQHVLCVGVPPIQDLRYQDIQEFTTNVLAILANVAPDTRHLAMAIHSTGDKPWDPVKALRAQFEGYLDAIQSGRLPPALEYISVVEIDSIRVERLRQALEQHLASANYASRVPAQDRWAYYLRSATPPRPIISGFTSDDPEGQDLLGITKEVEVLCSLLAAKAVEPPLSLGLFGDWGSGKSFFMRMMENQIKQLKEASKHAKGETAYCTNIVQLRFNAWYYIDTPNLWASLNSAIFEGLAGALLKKDATDSEYKRARLLANTIKSKDELAKAEQEKSEADAKLQESKQRLKQFEHYEANIEASLTPQAIIQGAWRIAIRQPEVLETIEETKKELNDKVEKAAKELNYPTTDAMKADLKTQLLELHGIGGRLQALAIAIRNTEDRWAWLWLILGVALIILALALVLVLLFAYRAYLVGLLGSGTLLVHPTGGPTWAFFLPFLDACNND